MSSSDKARKDVDENLIVYILFSKVHLRKECYSR